MRLSFDTYWPLLLLLVIPYLWRVQTKTLTDLSPRHLQLAGVIRSVIIALITLSLMQPVLYRSGAWESIVYLLDVSESVSPPAIQSAMQWIQQTNNLSSGSLEVRSVRGKLYSFRNVGTIEGG